MGCDIHFYVEHKVKNTWVSADTFEHCKDSDYYSQKNAYYNDRNYNLFAILADVRNGHGFAGIKTGEGFNPISEPKGLPDDISNETKREVDGMGPDGHSHSWLTLTELLEYDWTQTTKLQGWVDFKNWEGWARWPRSRGEGPESWCGAVSGGRTKHITAAEMEQLCKDYWVLRDNEKQKAFLEKHLNTYALAKWEVPYYKTARNFLSDTIPRLLKLAGGVKNTDKVRIVFFFDN